eukprot:scaffold3103_cov136-Cylindrotheca_fusiformis.AAC.36
MKRPKQAKLSSFFSKKQTNKDGVTSSDGAQQQPSRKRLRADVSSSSSRVWNVDTQTSEIVLDPLAEGLGVLLNVKPKYLGTLGPGRSSWIIHAPRWHPSSLSKFDTEWNLHPETRNHIRIYGRWFEENRWSQAWGHSIDYSNLANRTFRPLEESPSLPFLVEQVNQLMKGAMDGTTAIRSGQYHTYNACLQNWYTPDDTIGLHSDDESYLQANHPIFSLSWGGTRRFLLRPKKKKDSNKSDAGETVEIWLEDGDLLIMGGQCQNTHKHEVPKQRKKDPPTSNRICWTIRAIKTRS